VNFASRARGWARSLVPSKRSLIPPRSGWLRLATSFTSYLLLASAIATVIGKALAVEALEGVRHPILLLGYVISQDLFVYFGVASLLALLEMRLKRAWLLTFPLALGGAITATLNTGYLVMTGEQATWEAFTQLFARMSDVADITGEGLTTDVISRIVGGVLAGVALPVLIRFELRRRRWNFDRKVHGHARAVCAGWVAILALLTVVIAPRPRTAMARNLGKNALLSTVRTLAASLDTGSFKSYKPMRLVSEATVDAFAENDPHPNVLVVVLESTRFDRTSLSGREDAASTPTLVKLAEEGLIAPRTRAVLPHTTKSLFSILCGRYPLMQKKVVEVSADLRIQCLPAILDEAGYETAFFQSSWGTFEWRPRLVHRLGFRSFKAWEDIRGQELGYLASDDESLVNPFGKWLDEINASSNPWMATILTSATHHPYRLSRRANKEAKAAGLAVKTDEERYLRLIEAEDRMVAGLIQQLERRGLRDKTIVVVVGDHGEGFGEKGVKQHDNNFYEEGLRVPLVMTGPGVPVREVEGNASLVDVTPTLLSLLGIDVDEKARASVTGFDLTADDFPGYLPRYFTCWFEMRCRGFVVGDHKVVYEPQADEAWYYDLAVDPDEANPLALTQALERDLKELQGALQKFRARDYTVKWGETYIGEWRCRKGDTLCKHPGAKKEKYRYKRPEDKDAQAKGEEKAEGEATKEGEDPKAPKSKAKAAKKTPRQGREKEGTTPFATPGAVEPAGAPKGDAKAVEPAKGSDGT